MVFTEPYRPIPSAFRSPFRPIRVPVTSRDLAQCSVLPLSVDAEGWPDLPDAQSLANLLLANRCLYAEGPTEPLWKLLPPAVGQALASLPPGRMVKYGDTWWGALTNGSLYVRRGQQYGHLCMVPRPLVSALAGAGFFDIGFPNSPGAIASNILINHAWLPDLRRGDIPLPVLDLAHQCDKGGRMEALALGTFNHVYCYDYTGAYGAVLADLPDARDCVWIQSKDYHPDATWGFVRCLIIVPAGHVAPIAYRALISDRQEQIEGLRFVHGQMEVSLIKPEFDLALEHGCKAEILDAWWGYASHSERPFHDLVHRLYALREQHPDLKAEFKLLVNAMIGQMSSSHSWLDTVDGHAATTVSPLWNSVYASYVRGIQRVKLFRAVKDWRDVCSLTIDGMITTSPLAGSPHIAALGQLRLDSQGACTILTDFAKDRPGQDNYWRRAASENPAGESSFYLPLTYRAGLGVYNQCASLEDAHNRLGRLVSIRPEFPTGSMTRRVSTKVALADLLREPIATQSMSVKDL